MIMWQVSDLQNSDDPKQHWAAGEIERLQKELADLLTKEGPLNSERWTLDALIAKLEEWRAIASGKTCVSFENLCFGASSLWHQTHRENFRAVDMKPEALSGWILDTEGSVRNDFPAQVLEVLIRLTRERDAARTSRDEERKVRDSWVEEAERLSRENHRQRVKLKNRADFIIHLWQGMQAARAWIRGEFRDGPLGDPAARSWACLWCGEMLTGREHAKQHCAICPESPLVQQIEKLQQYIADYATPPDA